MHRNGASFKHPDASASNHHHTRSKEPTMTAHRLSLPFATRLHQTVTRLTQLPSRVLALAALARSRHSLRQLDDHLLRDIGLTRAEAHTEADRLRWDAPLHWRG
jgi:uncharacterized protein YjiS (DUF1127 family)